MSKDVNSANYVQPLQNVLGLDFGGTGGDSFFGKGIGGPGFLRNITANPDLPRLIDDITKRGAESPRGRGVDAQFTTPDESALNYALNFKLRNQNYLGKTTLYKNNSDFSGGPNTYLTEQEMLDYVTDGGYDSIKSYMNEFPQAFTSLDVDSSLPAGTAPVFKPPKPKTITVDGPNGEKITREETQTEMLMRQENEKQEEAQKLIDARSRQGETLFDKVRNIFDDPYDDYVDEEGRTIRGDFVKREDEALLKKNNLDEVVEDTGPGFTKEQGMELLDLYLQMGSLMTDEPPTGNITMGSYSVSPGLKLDVPNLYDRKRR